MAREIHVLINRVRADLPLTKEECSILNVWLDSKIKEQKLAGVFAIMANVLIVFGGLAYAVFNT